MNDLIEYKMGSASSEDVYRHLTDCSMSFNPPLAQRVDLREYAEKLATLSVTFEAWAGAELTGLIAAYFNDEKNRFAYISSVSTMPRYKGNGIASVLLQSCINYARSHAFRQVGLEVDSGNEHALGLYEKFGFSVVSRNLNTLTMKCELE